jgi:D-glycero-D-manno-heptose 1,7-bisphosphate phosphatase
MINLKNIEGDCMLFSNNIALVILDRDGVINHDSDEYIKTPEEWIEIEGSALAIKRLNEADITVVVATNQSGIGRKLFSAQSLDAIHHKMHKTLQEKGAHLDDVILCPHTPEDHCACRKPKPGMLQSIMRQYKISPTNTVMIGDSFRDLEAAWAARCECILVKTGKGMSTIEKKAGALGKTPIFDDLHAAVQALLG